MSSNTFSPEVNGELIRQQVLSYYTYSNQEQSITFEDLDDFFNAQMKYMAAYGARVGAGGMAFVVLWLVSKNRKTPIFILNQLSLLCFLVQSVLYIAYLLGGSANMTAVFTGYIQNSTTQFNITAASNVFQVLLIAFIEASLVFQVRMIFRSNNNQLAARILMGTCGLLGLTTVVFYLVACIRSISITFGSNAGVWGSMSKWIVNTPIILFASSVNVMSLVLVVKLLLAIRTRRYLGLKQLDSLHILFIMSGQTMIIPSVITIVDYARSNSSFILSPLGTFIVVLSLPLSAMWASASHNESAPQSLPTLARTQSRGQSYNASPGQRTFLGTSPQKIDFDNDESFRAYPTFGGSQNEKTAPPNDRVEVISPDERVTWWARANQIAGIRTYDGGDYVDEEFVFSTIHTLNFPAPHTT